MTYTVSTWQDALLAAGSTVLNQIVSFLPNLLGAVLLFLLGWIIAGWARTLVAKITEAAKLNHAVSGTTIEKFLEKAEWKGKIGDILGSAVRWTLILIFFIAAVNILGLTTVSLVLGGILSYIPRVLSAALILLAGILLAGVVEGIVKGATGALDASTSRLMGKLASWIVVIFTVLAAISELGIAAAVINTLIIGVVAALSVGFGLALGLGSKDLVKDVLSAWYRNVQKDLKRA